MTVTSFGAAHAEWITAERIRRLPTVNRTSGIEYESAPIQLTQQERNTLEIRYNLRLLQGKMRDNPNIYRARESAVDALDMINFLECRQQSLNGNQYLAREIEQQAEQIYSTHLGDTAQTANTSGIVKMLKEKLANAGCYHVEDEMTEEGGRYLTAVHRGIRVPRSVITRRVRRAEETRVPELRGPILDVIRKSRRRQIGDGSEAARAAYTRLVAVLVRQFNQTLAEADKIERENPAKAEKIRQKARFDLDQDDIALRTAFREEHLIIKGDPEDQPWHKRVTGPNATVQILLSGPEPLCCISPGLVARRALGKVICELLQLDMDVVAPFRMREVVNQIVRWTLLTNPVDPLYHEAIARTVQARVKRLMKLRPVAVGYNPRNLLQITGTQTGILNAERIRYIMMAERQEEGGSIQRTDVAVAVSSRQGQLRDSIAGGTERAVAERIWLQGLTNETAELHVRDAAYSGATTRAGTVTEVALTERAGMSAITRLFASDPQTTAAETYISVNKPTLIHMYRKAAQIKDLEFRQLAAIPQMKLDLTSTIGLVTRLIAKQYKAADCDDAGEQVKQIVVDAMAAGVDRSGRFMLGELLRRQDAIIDQAVQKSIESSNSGDPFRYAKALVLGESLRAALQYLEEKPASVSAYEERLKRRQPDIKIQSGTKLAQRIRKLQAAFDKFNQF
ncbi:MAG: hypothetical protein LBJ42_02075 [Holosporales bacterium]|jgi:hypothetical protein|nr:hypothetical protein [Holosporales bacterium]